MSKSTIKDLPNDICKAVPEFKENAKIMEIIRLAQSGEFHDFKNTQFACGKIALFRFLNDAEEPKLLPVADDVKNGVYDKSPDDEDRAQMKKDWLADGGTEESYNIMFGK